MPTEHDDLIKIKPKNKESDPLFNKSHTNEHDITNKNHFQSTTNLCIFFVLNTKIKGKIMKALWNNTIIAESNDTIEIEGSSYFPIDSVNLHLLKRSKHQSFCSWKGTAHYYSINIEDHTNTNAAWFYPSPFEKAIVIKGHIAFWKGVECIDD